MSVLLTLAWITLGCFEPPTNAAGPAAIDVASALETALSDAISRAEPSVVAISRFKEDNGQETLAVRGKARRVVNAAPPRAFRGRNPRERDSSDQISWDFGSGVVIGQEGQILTAYHVVKGASRLEVRATDRQSFNAEIIAADPRSDLAVIVPVAAPGEPAPRLRPLAIGDASRLRKGAFLTVLGNPFNTARDGKPSASWGILSNLARRLEPEMDEVISVRRALQLPQYPTLMQLDAKLNLGMSGGAVVNLKGELVGLTTMASSPSGFDAMAGYAMPLDRLGRRAVETLMQGKEIEYGLLGIKADPGLSNRVGDVGLNSPAAQGDLQINDEILAVNEHPVIDFDSLILAVNGYSPGDEVKLKIRRNGKELEKTVILAKFPVDGEVIATNRRAPWKGLRIDHLSVVNTRAMGANFLEMPFGGVVIMDVQADSPADRAGLKKWQVIRQVDKKPVLNPTQFEQAVAESSGPVSLSTDQGTVTIP